MSPVIATVDRRWKAKDVADFLGMSISWVYAAADRNELPHAYVGSRVRFDPEDVKRWFETQKVKRGEVLTFSGEAGKPLKRT